MVNKDDYPIHEEKHELLPKRMFGRKKHDDLTIEDVDKFLQQIKKLIKENEKLEKEVIRLRGIINAFG